MHFRRGETGTQKRRLIPPTTKKASEATLHRRTDQDTRKGRISGRKNGHGKEGTPQVVTGG